MCKETLIIEGVLTALKGLAGIMDTTEDTGENAKLGVKIDSAIRSAEYIVNGESIERDGMRCNRVVGCLNPVHPHISFRTCDDCKMSVDRQLCQRARLTNRLELVRLEDAIITLRGWGKW